MTGPGNKALTRLPSVSDLADEAGGSIMDLLDEDGWEHFSALSDVEKVRHRYLHGDCDDLALALHYALGWDVHAVNCEHGHMHRLVCSPEGRLLDASGWTSVKEMESRYGVSPLTVEACEGARACHSCIDEDDPEALQSVIAALLYLDCEPFVSELRPQIEALALSNGLDPEMPTPKRARSARP